MGERVLSWVKCKDCNEEFPVEAEDEDKNTIDNLWKVPRYCPFCGSTLLDFSQLQTEYYG